MWIAPSSSASCASPSVRDDLAHAPPTDSAARDGLQTIAQAERAALARLRRLGGNTDVITSCVHRLGSSLKPLPLTTVQVALHMLCELAECGQAVVHAGDAEGMKAAEAVLYAMERVMPGTELIMAPDRPRPLRNIGDPDASQEDRARAEALLGRVMRNSPLHLVFCHDDKVTLTQKLAYSLEFIRHANTRTDGRRDRAQPLSQELVHTFEQGLTQNYTKPAGGHRSPVREPTQHVLSVSRSEFPQDLHGVLILKDGWPDVEVFAMHSAPTHPTGSSRSLVLRWAQSQCPSQAGTDTPSSQQDDTPTVASDVADPALKCVLEKWASLLAKHGAPDLSAMLVRK